MEILGGLKAKNAEKQIIQFREFILSHTILDSTPKSIEICSDIFAELHKKGKHSGNYDVLIAGIAIENDLAIYTNNIKDFENIQDLKIVNWKTL